MFDDSIERGGFVDSRKRRFALLLVGLVTLLGSLLIAGPAAAATEGSAADDRIAVSVQEQFIGPQARPGCNSDNGPPADYFMLNHFTGTNVCSRCNESAWYWYRQGYWTWCWDLSAYHAELWVKPR
jgi:hypothetical protein